MGTRSPSPGVRVMPYRPPRPRNGRIDGCGVSAARWGPASAARRCRADAASTGAGTGPGRIDAVAPDPASAAPPSPARPRRTSAASRRRRGRRQPPGSGPRLPAGPAEPGRTSPVRPGCTGRGTGTARRRPARSRRRLGARARAVPRRRGTGRRGSRPAPGYRARPGYRRGPPGPRRPVRAAGPAPSAGPARWPGLVRRLAYAPPRQRWPGCAAKLTAVPPRLLPTVEQPRARNSSTLEHMTVVLAQAPPLTANQVLIFLLQLAVLLLAALCLGGLARRLGLPAVVGELATGILLGPSVFGRVAPGVAGWLLPAKADQAHLLDAVSQFSVLILVGVTGAHMDLRMVRRRSGVVVRVSLADLLIPLALGVGAGFLVPAGLLGPAANRPTFALFLGVALCVSAIPVIAKTLADLNLLHRDVGQLTLAAASIEDAVGWFLLSLVSTMVLGGLNPGRLALSAAELIGFVVLAATVGRPLVRRAMRFA